MTFRDRSYKNRPQNLARETGRVVRDLIAESTQSVDKVSSNLHAIPSAPITTSEGTGPSCCCDRTVYVSKDGAGDFDSIQQAIDDIDAYETPTAAEPWIISICPGEYAENIVGIDYVSLIGKGNVDSVIVSGATGPLYTLPDIGGHASRIKFQLAPTTTDQMILHTAGTHTGPTEIIDCIFDIASATNNIVGMFVNLQAGELFLKSNYMNYDMDGTHANVKSHQLINVSGTSAYHIYNCEVNINVADINDTVIFVNELTTSTSQGNISFNEISAVLSHAAYAGTAGLFYLHGAGTNKFIIGNHLVLTSGGGAGDTGYIIYMDTTATGGVISSIANHVGCFGFDNSYVINVAAGDSINSHFDKVYAVDGFTGAGTFNFAGSYGDGNFSVSNNVNIANECRWLDGVNHVGFRAPALAGSQIYDLPAIDGAVGEALTTNGAGVLSFDGGIGSVNLDDAYNNSPAGAKIITVDDGELELLAAVGYGITLLVGNGASIFKVYDDSCQVNEGTFGAGTVWPWAGAGTGMVWNPRLGAFRAGQVTGTEWDVGNVGEYSFGGGLNNTFSGTYSGGWGVGNIISGESSGCWGADNKVSGISSGIIGRLLWTTANYSFAMGHHNVLLQLPEPDTQYGIVDQHIIADPSTLGAEKVTNGTFTGSAAGWSAGLAWTYNANAVDKDADGVTTLSQAAGAMVTPPVANGIYLLTFVISNWTVGTVTPTVGGKAGAAVGANGTYRQLILATDATGVIFTPTNTARFTIDDVSLRQVIGGDLHVAGDASVTGDASVAGDISTTAIGLSNPPRCRMYKTANQSIPNATWTKVTWDAETWDSGGIGDLTTERITPGVASYCSVNANVFCQPTAIWRVAIYRSGVLITERRVESHTASHSLDINDIIQVNNTQYLEVFVYQNSGGALDIQGATASRCWFTVHRQS